MGRHHRLGALQVRVAGQDDVRVLIAALDERPLQIEQQAVDVRQRVADVQLEVGRHLVVAAAGGMQFAADVARPRDQRRLDVHMDVFEFGLPRKLAAGDFLSDGVERGADQLGFIAGEQAD